MARLSADLEAYFFAAERSPEVTLAEVLTLAGERVFGFLFVLLSFPSALPVPAPGYSVPFGVALFLLAVQLLWGRVVPWLPNQWYHHPIKLPLVQGVLRAGIPWLKRIEYLSRPRWVGVCQGKIGQGGIALMVALMAISMMIPLPLTNTLPAIAIFTLGFGLLEQDGLICCFGYLLGSLGLALTTSVIAALIWGGSNLWEMVKGWLGRS